MKPLHLCIMGHSGVGKSPLSDLFDMRGWDPYRIRDARDAHDKVKSKQEYESLRVGANRGDVCYQSQQSSLSVCTKWSTFKVRDMEQCLDNTDFDPRSDMRIEVFAPVLLEMIQQREQVKRAFDLDPDNILVVILNPTSTSFSGMDDPSPELQSATLAAVMERNRVSGNEVDLADALRRVEDLVDELRAWREFIRMENIRTLECLRWEHFEYRYHSDPTGERERARTSLFRAFTNPASWQGEEPPESWAGRLALAGTR
jgi:hypothetical protein